MSGSFSKRNLKAFIRALEFSAEKHRAQRRKGNAGIPYVNHPIKVTALLADSSAGDDPILLAAALLHDVLEDTDATPAEIEEKFGRSVLSVVREVTDDMSLAYRKRKQGQIDQATGLSIRARLIRLADKICNIRDIMDYQLTWTHAKKMRYVEFSKKVVDRIRGTNAGLEKVFDETWERAMKLLKK